MHSISCRAGRHPSGHALLLIALFLSGCAGATPGPSVRARPATDAEWRALRTARPATLPGAARVTVTSVEMLGTFPWAYEGTISPDLGVAELAVAGLLTRSDVDFVERRRFAEAARAERNGEPAPPGRPPVGVSQGAEFSAIGIYAPLSDEEATLEVRLTRLETGDIAGATRVIVAADADPVTVARGLVTGILEVLDDLDRLPDSTARRAGANAASAASVGPDAIHHFLRGLAYEEAWRWEEARRAYQAAVDGAEFPEAEAALARTARLRLGGTLAES